MRCWRVAADGEAAMWKTPWLCSSEYGGGGLNRGRRAGRCSSATSGREKA